MDVRRNGYTKALRRVPYRLREPLVGYLRRGKLPRQHPVLMAGIAGDITTATKIYEPDRGPLTLAGALAFIDEQVPDIARGHFVYMLRWEAQGGMEGRIE